MCLLKSEVTCVDVTVAYQQLVTCSSLTFHAVRDRVQRIAFCAVSWLFPPVFIRGTGTWQDDRRVMSRK